MYSEIKVQEHLHWIKKNAYVSNNNAVSPIANDGKKRYNRA